MGVRDRWNHERHAMSNDNLCIVKLEPRHWRDLKALRLEALQCDPAAFSSTYEETVTRPDEHWRERLANPRSIVLLAYASGHPVGMVGALLGDDGDQSVAVVFSMYVTAAQRRRGVGRLLMQALIAQVAANPAIVSVRLNVRSEQTAARRLYKSLGFRLASHDAEGELIMERPVRRNPSV
jgi:ribosomal protein S18 acetylase RimI-like enzyme